MKCTALTDEIPARCRNGFPTNGACFGHQCFTCGRWAAEDNPPACLREDLGPHIIDEAGRVHSWRMPR